MRGAIKQSCDIYFYEVARKLGVDRLSVTASKFGLGDTVLGGVLPNEKEGLVPDTKWKKNNLGKGWVLGETLITGIGQGYIQTTPLQLCLMTAQLANGGYKIYPKITVNKNDEKLEDIKSQIAKNYKSHNELKKGLSVSSEQLLWFTKPKKHEPLYKNPENVKFVLNAMFASTNEAGGTSFRSRIKDRKSVV